MSPVVLATRVGAAGGSEVAAAALACAASEPERAALLVDFEQARAPRPSMIATAGARALEERLAVHLPEAEIASRGFICRLRASADPDGIEQLAAALPLVRDSAGIVHLPPALLRSVLEEPRIRATAALLRADLKEGRALTALAVHDLIGHGLRVGVLKRSPGWLAARLAVLGGVSIPGALPPRLAERLVATDDKKLPSCYDGEDGAEGEERETRANRSHP